MNTLKTIIIGFIAGLAGAYAFYIYEKDTVQAVENRATPYSVTHYKSHTSHKPIAVSPKNNTSSGIDFSVSASLATPSVVYINSISQGGSSYSYWDILFNGGGQKRVSSGSGVIFTDDGYIVTNHHVVEFAETIEVLYNKKIYEAELVGSDPSTDLAVLKIKENNLPPITLGSSKNLLVGEWVIAVGNPFSLSSTVTAGIVSAKGRRINIVANKFPIESFIQTDAAINPGNSGGALVNKNGELVGINTAILSRTGSYTGYAFAIPVDIAKKVISDIIKYGIVQKPFFGARLEEYDFQNARKYKLDTDVESFRGVLLTKLQEGGSAKKAGLKPGDIIVQFNAMKINSKSEFEEELSYLSPGDKVKIQYLRNGKEGTAMVTLVNKNGETRLARRKLYSDAMLGATLEAVEYGVRVSKIKGGLFKKLNIPENYTILSINQRRIKDPQEVMDFFNQYKGRVLLYGITSARIERPFSFNLQ